MTGCRNGVHVSASGLASCDGSSIATSVSRLAKNVLEQDGVAGEIDVTTKLETLELECGCRRTIDSQTVVVPRIADLGYCRTVPW